MTRKAAIFRLIHSMSQSEKRYFRIFVRKDNANYLKLFDAVERQSDYDEAAIRKLFRGETFAKQLHVAKNYLTELIMRSLRAYHARSSVYPQVLSLIHDAEILFVRELYDHCHQALEKAIRLAGAYEFNGLALEALDGKRRLALARAAGQGGLLPDIVAEERVLLENARHLNSTWKITADLFQLIGRQDFLDNPLVAGKTSASSVRSECLRRHARYSWYFMNGNKSQALREVNALLRMLEAHPHTITEEPAPYITAIGNKISMLLGTSRDNETEALLLKMREAPEKFRFRKKGRFTLRLWLRLFNLELEFLRKKRQPERVILLVHEIRQFLEEHEKSVPATYALLFRFQFVLVNYEYGDLRLALKEMNVILNSEFDSERIDLQCEARLLNLVIHFELGNILVLRYIVDSTKRFLIKHKAFHELEKTLLKLFRDLSRAPKNEFRSHFRNANNRIPADGNYSHFDYKKWIAERSK